MHFAKERDMATTTLTRTRASATTAAIWTLTIICAGMFLFAGSSKLAGERMMVQTFETIGLGQWFRYLTGIIEVGGAVLLLIPSLAFYGAIALAATMVGAVITHLFVIGGSPLVPILLLAATGTIAYLRRPVA
jgi:putative oxidoreductase